jgi:hypothetical protein
MNEQGLSRDSLNKIPPSTLLPRLGLLAAALSLSLGLAGSCSPATDGGGGTGGTGGTPTTGTGGIAMTGGTTGTAGVIGNAGTTGACQGQGPPVLKLAWSIAVFGTTTVQTCQQAGATTVQVLFNSTPIEFPCTAGSGTTMTIPPGSYTARFILTGNGGTTILSQGTVNNLTVPACGTLDLGNVRFNVAAPSTGMGGTTGMAGTTGAAGSPGTGGKGGTTGAAGSSGAAGFTGGTGPCDAKPLLKMHNCTIDMACHDSKGSAAAFDMVTAGWETKLVGRLPKAGGANGLGSQCINVAGAGAYLVAGSVPAKGLFLDKLRNPHQVCGGQMPLIPPLLSDVEMDCVQRWANALTKP